eukprot:548513-Pyramimonas_sp.AAC.1
MTTDGLPIPADAPQGATAQRFQPCPHISQRYPGLSGNLLQQRVFEDYQVPATKPRLKFFDENNNEALTRHRLNQRDHGAVREQYVRSIMHTGCIVGVRGQAWVIQKPSDTDVEHFDMLSAATLTEALYEAVKRCKKTRNQFVERSVESGVSNYMAFHMNTPDDVILYLKQLNNEFHRGASTTFLEVTQKTESAEASWGAFSK